MVEEGMIWQVDEGRRKKKEAGGWAKGYLC